MTSLSPLGADATDLILAVLASEYPLPVSTGTVEDRTGFGPQYGLLTYRMLNRLARRGEVEKMTIEDFRSRYWRLAAAPAAGTVPAQLERGARDHG